MHSTIEMISTPHPAADCPNCGAAAGHWPSCPNYPLMSAPGASVGGSRIASP